MPLRRLGQRGRQTLQRVAWKLAISNAFFLIARRQALFVLRCWNARVSVKCRISKCFPIVRCTARDRTVSTNTFPIKKTNKVCDRNAATFIYYFNFRRPANGTVATTSCITKRVDRRRPPRGWNFAIRTAYFHRLQSRSVEVTTTRMGTERPF